MTTVRPSFLKSSAAATLAAALPSLNFAQSPAPAPTLHSNFAPHSDG